MSKYARHDPENKKADRKKNIYMDQAFSGPIMDGDIPESGMARAFESVR